MAALLALGVPFIGNFLADTIFEPSQELNNFKTYWFPNQIPVFFIGIAAYHAIEKWHVKSSTARACVFVTSALLLFIFPSDSGFHPEIQYTVAFAILAFGLAKGGAPLLVNKPIIFLGKISYSAYLTILPHSWSAFGHSQMLVLIYASLARLESQLLPLGLATER